MISVVAVYNDRAQFEAMLAASLARQRQPHQLVALDNTTARFPSAAAALNEGGRQGRGDYLMFAHQDVRFDDAGWLDAAETYLRGLPDVGVAGVAGARASGEGRRIILSNVEDSDPPQRADHEALDSPQPVETVDECAFFVPRGVFERFPFDERTCNGWHLFAVEYALRVRTAGLGVYALPLPLYHRSGGAVVRFMGFATYENAYFRSLRQVIRKHGDRYQNIPTTCGNWSTRRSLTLQRFPPRQVRLAVSGWFRQRLRSAP